MKKLLNKKIIRISLIVCGVLLLGYLVMPFIFSKRIEVTEFDQIYKKSNGFVLPKLISVEKNQDSVVKGKGLIKTEIVSPEGKTGVNNLSYWDDWMWDTKLIKLEVLSISVEDGDVYASMLLPTEMDSALTEKEYSLKCSLEETSVVYIHAQINREEVYKPAIEMLTPGDFLYAYCLDAQCSTLGRQCIIER